MVLKELDSEFGQFKPPSRILMGPGPSDCHPRVLQAMAMPLVGHLDPAFQSLMDEVKSMLRYVFQTTNPLTIPVSGTGSAGMEACLANLLEPGDKVVIGVNGVFGLRMADAAARFGAEVTTIEIPWGEVFEAEEVREVLDRIRPKVFALVHGETSTGAEQPLEEIGGVVRDSGALFVVDCVTTLAGSPVHVDKWRIDAAFSGTQKCLSCPPGLAPVTFGPRAVEALDARRTKVQSWYLDMTMVRKYWGEERVYHHTAPVSMAYGLREGLRLVLEEGLEARWQRHRQNHLALKAGLEALGLTYAAAEGRRLPQLNAVHVPGGIDEAAIRARLLKEFGIEIGAGLGAFAGKVWRIGLMGETSTEANVYILLSALEKILLESKVAIEPGSATAAAHSAWNN